MRGSAWIGGLSATVEGFVDKSSIQLIELGAWLDFIERELARGAIGKSEKGFPLTEKELRRIVDGFKALGGKSCMDDIAKLRKILSEADDLLRSGTPPKEECGR